MGVILIGVFALVVYNMANSNKKNDDKIDVK
jgi:hypothetical protein